MICMVDIIAGMSFTECYSHFNWDKFFQTACISSMMWFTIVHVHVDSRTNQQNAKSKLNFASVVWNRFDSGVVVIVIKCTMFYFANQSDHFHTYFVNAVCCRCRPSHRRRIYFSRTCNAAAIANATNVCTSVRVCEHKITLSLKFLSRAQFAQQQQQDSGS